MPLTLIEVAFAFGEVLIYTFDILIIYPVIALASKNLNYRAKIFRNLAFISIIVAVIILLLGSITNIPSFQTVYITVFILTMVCFYLFTLFCALSSDIERPQLKKRK